MANVSLSTAVTSKVWKLSEELVELLAKATEALRRDLNHIYVQSAAKKLPPASARDLAAYIKTLAELAKVKKSKEAELTRASQAELEALAKELLVQSTK